MTIQKEILFLQPIFKEVLWGGSRLREEYNYDIPSDHTGECWAISAHDNGDCKVATGVYRGISLSELWTTHKELFGYRQEEKFPLLVKIIDAKDDLSIQVHPDDQYARINENGASGKTECWYILDCEQDSTIVIGHNAKNKQELRDMIEEERWGELIRTIPIKKGDFFQINPGTVHAIKAGTLILETQQNSDLTYRVYDYNRLTNGKPRELHIKKSLDVITAPFLEENKNEINDIENASINGEGYTRERLVKCPFYTVDKVAIKDKAALQQNKSFVIYSVIEGEGTINNIPIVKGSHFIVPYQFGDYEFRGNMTLISSYLD